MNQPFKSILIGTGIVLSIAAVVCGIYLFFVFMAFDSIGPCGFDDGPFKAVMIDNLPASGSVQSFELKDNGQLMLYNRADSLSPLLALVENGVTQWTLDTDVRNTKGYETYRIWEISGVTITQGTDPIQLSFIGHWTYGAEAGSMEIDRKTGDNSFCLSW